VDLAAREAAREADRVLTELGIDSLPVNPFAIAEARDIDVSSAALDCSGCLVKTGDSFGILYSNTLRNEGFERFTVAHELGHFHLPGHPRRLFGDGSSLHQSRSGFVSHDPVEREADLFAASLLMPERLFIAALRTEREPGIRAIKSLAALCNASITATALRFAMFSDDPVAVVMSEGNTVLWCEMSRALHDLRGLTWLRKGSVLPRGTTSASFNLDQANVSQRREADGTTDLSLWFDGAPDVEMMEDVFGLGSYGRTLTVLFTTEAIDTEEDEQDGD
jgi:hypothetical protein